MNEAYPPPIILSRVEEGDSDQLSRSSSPASSVASTPSAKQSVKVKLGNVSLEVSPELQRLTALLSPTNMVENMRSIWRN